MTEAAFFKTIGRGGVVPVALVVGWELLTHYHLVNTHILVRPELVLASAIELVREGDLAKHLFSSLARDLAGFLAGSLAGLLVGGVMGGWRISERLFGPSFHAAKQVAVFAWIPLISVWFGTGETAKVLFIALAAFYPVAVNTYEGIRSVSRDYLEVTKVFRFARRQVWQKAIWPSALPSIFAGLHLALIYSWLGTLGAEYLLAAAPGVGNLMIDGRERFAMDQVLLGVILAGIIGFALSAVASLAEGHIVRWRIRGV
jgi:sulfonate transport system permease protein